ncbi:MAG: hypothetical protein R3F65_33495 [bacterium]
MRVTPRLLACALTGALALGCGYRLVGADDHAAAAHYGPLQIGVIDDLTAHGDLGLHAAHRLRAALAPRLADGGATLTGTIRPIGDLPLAFDARRRATARTAGVELELRVDDPAGPQWSSGLIRRARPWLRGPDPLEDRAARRAATLDALDDALTDALARLDTTGDPR